MAEKRKGGKWREPRCVTRARHTCLECERCWPKVEALIQHIKQKERDDG